MTRLAFVLVALVAAQHLMFLTLQMFLWEHEIGRNVFGTTPETAAISASLAKQQGLYNGFLAAGLIWGLLTRKADFVVFFLLCVIAAGVFGALTVSPRIFVVQALPALLALGAFVGATKRRQGAAVPD
jgi:putative membrane protein